LTPTGPTPAPGVAIERGKLLSLEVEVEGMIKHVVFFKFKQEVIEAERSSVLDELRALPEKIDVIREFEVGEDVLRSPRSWDAVLIASYDDLGALQKYARHDDHLPVVLKLQSMCDAIGSVDFEY
jgi:Stress responsive A/B Barrel Domain